jgi:hypothetical protein
MIGMVFSAVDAPWRERFTENRYVQRKIRSQLVFINFDRSSCEDEIRIGIVQGSSLDSAAAMHTGSSMRLSLVILWYLLLVFVCVACLLVLEPKFAAAIAAQPSSLFPIPFLFFAAFEINVLVHHAARIIAAHLLRMRLLGFVFGPFVIRRIRGRVRVGFDNRQNMLTGSSTFAPRTLERLRMRCTWLLVAGPAATILFGLLLLLVAQSPNPIRDPLNTLFLGAMALVGINLGIRLLLPIPLSRSPSYGTMLADIAKGKPTAEVLLLVSGLTFEAQQGVRPRQWSGKCLDLALRLTERSELPERATVCFLAYYRALDMGDPDRAALFLDEALAKVKSPSLFSRVMLEKAFSEAYFRRDANRANEAFKRITDWSTIPHHTWLRVSSAIALSEGKIDESQRQAREALEIVRSMPVVHPLALEWLSDLAGRTHELGATG